LIGEADALIIAEGKTRRSVTGERLQFSRGLRIVACVRRGHHETWEALHLQRSEKRRASKGRSLIDIARWATGKLTETDPERWYRGRPKRIETEMGNSDSELLHSTDERGEPKPKGASGGKAEARGWDRSEER
jgi:hypothetical protein